MKTVHLIFNAHLDPVWLWPWSAGLDEALATCRSACDRLDANPDIFFTRGEAWVYQQIERCDPALFERIRKHVAAGRWEITGGWWIQPDCNFPAGHSLAKQIELGHAYFSSRFGLKPNIGFNPDSFGHTATLPQVMHAAGQDTYVFMRPQEHERKLPARLFRWRGYEDGPEVLAFRIASTYNSGEQLEHEHWRIHNALNGLPEGITHTMVFLGIGDHGGGPTERLIEQCRKLQKPFEEQGIRLVFSTMSRFFDAVRPEMGKLPLVTGELQFHAVGCYSVHRPIKTAIRRAEDLLHRAELLTDGRAGAEKDTLQAAWQQCCFNQFHDTLGGTCLPSAYVAVLDQVGSAATAGDQALAYTLRRKLSALPDDPHQRAIFWNASDSPFDGYAEAEPWLGMASGPGEFELLDESDAVVPYQSLLSEALVTFSSSMPRILLRLKMKPGQIRALRMRKVQQKPQYQARVLVNDRVITSYSGTSCDLARGLLCFGSDFVLLPRLELLDDPTDTWSHGVARYQGATVAEAQWSGTTHLQRGPIMASLVQHGTIGQSPLRAEWRVYADEPFVELRLRITWNERLRLLKLVVPTPSPVEGHTDGISGGHVGRPADGKEMPIRDWMLMHSIVSVQDTVRAGGAGESQLGIVTPDTFAADVMPESVRITLLRSCYLALHDPYAATTEHGILADRGQHEFRFRFYCGSVTTAQLESSAHTLRCPPLYADLTRGMK